MSRPVNEPQLPSTSPPHSRHTSSTTPVDSDQRRRHTGGQTSPRQLNLSSRQDPETSSASGGSLSRGYPLHEFHSLLEAAQRIANSAPFDTEGHRWREDDQPEPIIHLNRRRLGELSQRRTPSREYRGRPHVPGEDSGSERESYEHEMDSEMNTQRERRTANNLWLSSGSTQSLSESDTNMDPPYPLEGVDPDTSRHRPDQGRIRDRQQEEEEERDLLEEALARSRAARSRFEADNQRNTLSDSQRTRYSTTGSLPTSQSFYDWAPEPLNTTDLNPNIFRSRSRATSIRRWRPAERLQDYASNHARRDSGNTITTPQMPAHEFNSVFSDLGSTATPSRAADTAPGSHEDVVDRVERALQQYRIARRAFRPSNVDIPFEAIPNPSTRRLPTPPPPGDRSATGVLEPSDSASAAAQNGSDTLDPTDELGSNGRTELSGLSSREHNTSSTTLRWAPAGLQRREDPLRQRIREQIRERRRRSAQQALESGNGRDPPLARGPLFEGPSAPQFAIPSDVRRVVEQLKSDVREHSAEFKRAKGALRYLASLRDPDMNEVKAWTTASELGLHNKGLEEKDEKNLPWSVESLPTPSSSSWLEPGMTWTGVQDANDPGEKPTRSFVMPDNTLLVREQRERIDLASRQNESFRTRMRSIRDPLERTFFGDGATDSTSTARNSMQVLEDAERSLSTMLEQSEELLRENDRQLRDNDRRLTLLDEALRRRTEAQARQVAVLSQASRSAVGPDSDWWNVKVSLHSVDEEQMTVSGTMTASHKLNRPSYNVGNGTDDTTESEESNDTSMDSFFTGEIIDFVRHGLDTLPSSSRPKGSGSSASSQHRRQQDEWKVGGPETDLSYWAGIGPFKREIDRVIKAKEDDDSRAMQVDEGQPQDKHNTDDNDSNTTEQEPSTSADNTNKQRSGAGLLPLTVLSDEEKYSIKMDTMADLLCNTKWLNENIGAEGWILMRWKERCFVAPGTEPNPDVRIPWMSGQPRETSQSMNTSRDDASTWNVNDLIAHNRMRRRRERDARVWSTNAAEREELATATSGPSSSFLTTGESGSRPSWGLTISGFYYVALERQTGRIEALYYDCGSTPFQRLKMSPQTLYRVPQQEPTRSRHRVRGRDEDVVMTSNITTAAEKIDGDAKPDFSGIAGLKTSFSIVEFR